MLAPGGLGQAEVVVAVVVLGTGAAASLAESVAMAASRSGAVLPSQGPVLSLHVVVLRARPARSRRCRSRCPWPWPPRPPRRRRRSKLVVVARRLSAELLGLPSLSSRMALTASLPTIGLQLVGGHAHRVGEVGALAAGVVEAPDGLGHGAAVGRVVRVERRAGAGQADGHPGAQVPRGVGGPGVAVVRRRSGRRRCRRCGGAGSGRSTACRVEALAHLVGSARARWRCRRRSCCRCGRGS